MIITSLLIGTQIFNPQLMVSADSIDLLTSKKVYFPGETIQIIGHFLPNAVLHIDLVNPLDNSKNSTQVQTDDTGRFQKKILIPYSAPNGTWKIVASSGNRLLSVDISIISSNPNKQNETIPLVTMCCGKLIYIGPLLPLKQFKSGVSLDKIQCKTGFVLIGKRENENPACVRPLTALKLSEGGWETVRPIWKTSQELSSLGTVELTVTRESWTSINAGYFDDTPYKSFQKRFPSTTNPDGSITYGNKTLFNRANVTVFPNGVIKIYRYNHIENLYVPVSNYTMSRLPTILEVMQSADQKNDEFLKFICPYYPQKPCYPPHSGSGMPYDLMIRTTISPSEAITALSLIPFQHSTRAGQSKVLDHGINIIYNKKTYQIGIRGIESPQTTLNSTTNKTNPESICETNGGKWDEKYRECVGVSSETCKALNGTYYFCASACRHTHTEVCTENCVQVCTVK